MADDTAPVSIRLTRVGDFYEAYGVSAELVARDLSLTTTRRHGTSIVGIPAHAIDRYTVRLIGLGYMITGLEASDAN